MNVMVCPVCKTFYCIKCKIENFVVYGGDDNLREKKCLKGHKFENFERSV